MNSSHSVCVYEEEICYKNITYKNGMAVEAFYKLNYFRNVFEMTNRELYRAKWYFNLNQKNFKELGLMRFAHQY